MELVTDTVLLFVKSTFVISIVPDSKIFLLNVTFHRLVDSKILVTSNCKLLSELLKVKEALLLFVLLNKFVMMF